MMMLASGNPVFAQRARAAVKREGSLLVVNGDPLQQCRDVGGLDALVAPRRTEPGAQLLGRGRSEQQARGALGDLAGARIGPRAPERAGERDKGPAWLVRADQNIGDAFGRLAVIAIEERIDIGGVNAGEIEFRGFFVDVIDDGAAVRRTTSRRGSRARAAGHAPP